MISSLKPHTRSFSFPYFFPFLITRLLRPPSINTGRLFQVAVDFGDKDAYLFYSYHRDQPKKHIKNISHFFMIDRKFTLTTDPFTLNFDDQFQRTTRPFISSIIFYPVLTASLNLPSIYFEFLHNHRTRVLFSTYLWPTSRLV